MSFSRETIGRRNRRIRRPVFEPHLTLAIGPDSADEAHRRLRGVAAGPIELRAAGVHFTAKFTRTLFVRFDSSPPLEKLRESLGLVGGAAFDPHVSLLYKKNTGGGSGPTRGRRQAAVPDCLVPMRSRSSAVVGDHQRQVVGREIGAGGFR